MMRDEVCNMLRMCLFLDKLGRIKHRRLSIYQGIISYFWDKMQLLTFYLL